MEDILEDMIGKLGLWGVAYTSLPIRHCGGQSALMLTAVNLSYNIFSNLASGWGLRGVVPTGAGLNELVVER